MPLDSARTLKELWLPLGILALALAYSVPRLHAVWHLEQRGMSANGTVVDHRLDLDGTTCSVVAFQDRLGTMRQTGLASCSNRPPPIGTTVALRYLPDRPEVTITAGTEAYFWPVLALMLGLGLFWLLLPSREGRNIPQSGV